MSQKQITALIIIFLYMIATIAIGLIVSKMKSKKKASQSNEDFLMAGKSLGPLTLAGTLFAANTGGASTTGIATNVFQYGLSASWYVIAGGIGFILVSFIAPYFRRAAASTVPQIIGKRYGKPSHMVTAFTSIAALFMATGAQIIATWRVRLRRGIAQGAVRRPDLRTRGSGLYAGKGRRGCVQGCPYPCGRGGIRCRCRARGPDGGCPLMPSATSESERHSNQ